MMPMSSLIVVFAWSLSALATQTAGLKIIVIEGEDAVNVVQQKTAVAPIVEVRDRNNLPVPGAVVTFTIGSGNTAAFAGGAQTLTITTNAAGRAAIAAVNPLSSGAVQINVQAAFQGQTAAAAIAQTNVLTAAEAATASGAASTATTAGTGAAGGGGGLSTAAIAGIVGGAGAAAAGAVVAGSGDEAAAPAGPVSSNASGAYAGTGSVTFTTSFSDGRVAACTHTKSLTGTLTFGMQTQPDGIISGTATTTALLTVTAVSTGCSTETNLVGSAVSIPLTAPITGNAQGLTFSFQTPFSAVPLSGGTVSGTRTVSFTGTLSAGVVTGTLRVDEAAEGTTLGAPLTLRGSSTASVSLR